MGLDRSKEVDNRIRSPIFTHTEASPREFDARYRTFDSRYGDLHADFGTSPRNIARLENSGGE